MALPTSWNNISRPTQGEVTKCLRRRLSESRVDPIVVVPTDRRWRKRILDDPRFIVDVKYNSRLIGYSSRIDDDRPFLRNSWSGAMTRIVERCGAMRTGRPREKSSATWRLTAAASACIYRISRIYR